MSELRVRVTGDAAGFNQTLDQAKRNAAAFNQSLVAQSKQTQAQNNRIAGIGQAAGKGIAIANAAGSLSSVPGIGQAAGQIAGAGMAFVGLKEAANQLKMPMGRLAGTIGVFAAIWIVGTKIVEEANKKVKALGEQLESQLREQNQSIKTEKAYREVLEKNRRSMTDADYKRLREGVTRGDRSAMAEVRSRFGGTELNKELAKDLIRQRVEAMPDGFRRDVAMEQLRAQAEREKLRERVGSSPSQATRVIAGQILAAINQESANKLAEIQRKQLEELKKIAGNTKTTTNPFR